MIKNNNNKNNSLTIAKWTHLQNIGDGNAHLHRMLQVIRLGQFQVVILASIWVIGPGAVAVLFSDLMMIFIDYPWLTVARYCPFIRLETCFGLLVINRLMEDNPCFYRSIGIKRQILILRMLLIFVKLVKDHMILNWFDGNKQHPSLGSYDH